MKVTLTGTPGTGKTTVSDKLTNEGFEIIHLTEFLEKHEIGEIVDGERDVPIEEMVAAFRKQDFEGEKVIEGHLSHYISSHVCVVLRCRPDILEDRLSDRGYPGQKINENVEAEKIDVILSEAIQNQDTVVEIDTTDKSVEETVKEIKSKVARKENDYGNVDWTEFL